MSNRPRAREIIDGYESTRDRLGDLSADEWSDLFAEIHEVSRVVWSQEQIENYCAFVNEHVASEFLMRAWSAICNHRDGSGRDRTPLENVLRFAEGCIARLKATVRSDLGRERGIADGWTRLSPLEIAFLERGSPRENVRDLTEQIERERKELGLSSY